MIKKHSSSTNTALKITATLLNSWNYLFKVDEEYYEKAYNDFVNSLKKIKTPPTPAMLNGLQFEKDCMEGKVPFISELIAGGAYQVFAKKTLHLEGFGEVLVLGYLDVLKEGLIYDIKRVGQFELQKYYHSAQHHIYLFLVDEAKSFKYLIAQGTNNDNLTIYTEEYTRDDYIPVEDIIVQFYHWLQKNNLYEVYKQNWSVENTEGDYL